LGGFAVTVAAHAHPVRAKKEGSEETLPFFVAEPLVML
jgi:hypothetical protein